MIFFCKEIKVQKKEWMVQVLCLLLGVQIMVERGGIEPQAGIVASPLLNLATPPGGGSINVDTLLTLLSVRTYSRNEICMQF
jgi:hypothetical protein